uniref:Uncharacterized protein n=1 Tax=Rhizophora mucronata TaxID=61149 RepID=A0A2P2PXU8_RHIMU
MRLKDLSEKQFKVVARISYGIPIIKVKRQPKKIKSWIHSEKEIQKIYTRHDTKGS